MDWNYFFCDNFLEWNPCYCGRWVLTPDTGWNAIFVFLKGKKRFTFLQENDQLDIAK